MRNRSDLCTCYITSSAKVAGKIMGIDLLFRITGALDPNAVALHFYRSIILCLDGCLSDATLNLLLSLESIFVEWLQEDDCCD